MQTLEAAMVDLVARRIVSAEDAKVRLPASVGFNAMLGDRS
jgi:hypothetical protein